MARVIRKVLLAPRGQVRHEVLPLGCMVMRIGTWAESPYAWVWVDPAETRLIHVSFLIVGSSDEVADDGFYPVNSFAGHGSEDGMWFGLIKWGAVL
jgi:hypothetical protein